MHQTPAVALQSPRPTQSIQNRRAQFATADALMDEIEKIRDIHDGIQEADAGEFATDDQVKAVFAKYGA